MVLYSFEVFDIFGQHFTTMTFVSDERFYLGEDENNYYLKFNFEVYKLDKNERGLV